MTGHIEVALPFWLDRPDEEALDVALSARDARFGAVWIGEMATYDAFTLATAIGHRAPGLALSSPLYYYSFQFITIFTY